MEQRWRPRQAKGCDHVKRGRSACCWCVEGYVQFDFEMALLFAETIGLLPARSDAHLARELAMSAEWARLARARAVRL